MQVLPPILITGLPFFLSLLEWCCQVQYALYYKSLDPSLSEQITRRVGKKIVCWLFLTKSWTWKAHFVQQPETATAAFIFCCNLPNFDSAHTTFSCNIWWALSWRINLFPTSYPALSLLSFLQLFLDHIHQTWVCVTCYNFTWRYSVRQKLNTSLRCSAGFAFWLCWH